MKPLILIVDDEPEITELTAFVLEQYGFDTCTANSASEALSLTGSQRFDLIISDYRMPSFSGKDFLCALRKLGNQTPVCFITGFADMSEKEAQELGATKVFLKPYESKALIDHIIEVVGNKAS